jgi:signal transduction histidine kinase
MLGPMTAEPASATSRSPLLGAVLAVVDSSATAAEVEERLEAAGVKLQPRLAESLLAELAQLGLVRAARRDAGAVRYVATSLGQRATESGVYGLPATSLEELERLRTDLTSTIAHELRTPLTAVRTSVGLLLEPTARPTEEQRHALLESIERNAERMQRLITDLLDLSRFRAGSIPLQLRRFRAHALAQSVLESIAPLAEKADVKLELASSVPEGHEVYGDRRRLEQALLNLVSNAVRFSPRGAIVIVGIARAGQTTKWTVTDSGPGIPQEDQARLFERFFVGRSDTGAARDGVGLGLPTALAIAQAHGGTIEVDSTVGRGSTFTLAVPSRGPDDEP